VRTSNQAQESRADIQDESSGSHIPCGESSPREEEPHNRQRRCLSRTVPAWARSVAIREVPNEGAEYQDAHGPPENDQDVVADGSNDVANEAPPSWAHRRFAHRGSHRAA